MKYIIQLIFLLAGIQVFGQSWNFRTRSSDFDGNLKSTSCTGSGGSYPYTSPKLTVNYFEEDASVSFYLSGAGYTGCDGNKVTLVFDGETRFHTYSVSDNQDHDVIFFEYFIRSGNSTKLPVEIIFNEMMNSRRVSLRYESDCFKRDYYFSMDGFKESVLKVLSEKNLENEIVKLVQMNEFNDSLRQVINTSESNFIEKYDPQTIDMYKLFFGEKYKPYKMRNDEIQSIIQITNSVRLHQEMEEVFMMPYSHFSPVLNLHYNLSPTNEICGITSLREGDTLHTGYFVDIKNDSLRLKLTSSQTAIERTIEAYNGSYWYSVNRLLRRLINDDFEGNTLSQSTLDGLARRIMDGYVYQLRIVKDSKNLGGFEYRSFKSSSWFPVYGLSFPYTFRKTPEEIRREQFVQDSTYRWANTPDQTFPPLQFHQVSKHPTTKDCPEVGLISSQTCVNNYITDHLRARIDVEEQEKFKEFSVIVVIDGYGNIKLQEIRGLNKKRTEQIENAFKGIFPILPGRNGWGTNPKVVNVIASFNIKL